MSRWLVSVALALAVAVAAPARADPLYTFVSAPDTWNADIGTVQGASGWDAGEPDSINPDWQRATDTILARFATHSPAFVLVAGDLVNGHWYDAAPEDTFGVITGRA